MFADCWTRIVFLIKDIRELVVSELALEKRNELVCLPFVSVERSGFEVELEQRVGFL